MKVRFVAVVAALLFVASHAASAQTKTVTLGASLQLTGNNANLGRYFRDGYQAAVDRINEKGGLVIGGATYRLVLKVLDNQSDLNLGVQQYVQLLTREKVDFLLGPYSSNDTINDSTVAEKYRVPMVAGGGAAAQIFDRGYKYIFGTSPPAENYFGSTVEMMTKLDPRPNRIALLAADDAFDVSLAKGTRALAAKNEFEIVIDQQYSEHNTDFSATLALVKSKAPDAILWGGHETEALNFIRQAKSLDVNARDLFAITVGVPSADFRKALGRDAEYAFGMSPWLASPLLHDQWFGDGAQFAKLFLQHFNYEPDYHVASAVSVVETFAYALQAAGTLDKDTVRDAISKSDFECIYAHVRFGETGQIDLPQIVIQVQDGKVVPIYTDHFLNKPRYPVPPWGKRG